MNLKIVLPLFLAASGLAGAVGWELTPATVVPAACCTVGTSPDSPATYTSRSIYQLEARFTDDSGRTISMSELRGRPVVLTMFFASCGYACPLQVADMQAIRAKLPVGVRERTALVLVSFDVARDTPKALAAYRAKYSLDSQWTLLHGDNDAVRELAALVGVKFKQEADGAFSHSNILTVLNTEGEISYQRNGLKAGIDETVAAVEAAAK